MSEDKSSDGSGGIRVDTDLIRQLAELLNEQELSEIEVEEGERRIVVKRKLSAPAMASAPTPIAAASTQDIAPSASPAADEAAAGNHPGAVKSPMVGTAYLAGEPGARPFVSPGSKVAAGDTLLIIEAMKVMNPITAPNGGIVRQVLVQDAQPIEFDQPLIIIE